MKLKNHCLNLNLETDYIFTVPCLVWVGSCGGVEGAEEVDFGITLTNLNKMYYF